MPLLRINYTLLAPWIVFSVPSSALFQQSVPVLVLVVALGMIGMLFRKPILATLASISMLSVVIWGKIASDIFALSQPDSAVILLQFMLVIFLMEASKAVLTYDVTLEQLSGKEDEPSIAARLQVTEWVRTQLLKLATLSISSIGLSLGLLVLGSLISVEFNQIAVSGVLVLVAVAAILILLTYRREPEDQLAR